VLEKNRMSSDTIKTWHSGSTEHTACSVECCNHPDLGHIAAVGTYQLDKESGNRHGQITLGNVSTVSAELVTYTPHVSHTCPGVLDMKWSSHTSPILAVAESSGDLVLYFVTLDFETSKAKLSMKSKLKIADGLALALEWSQDNESIIVSDSKGYVSLVAMTNEETLIRTQIYGHDFEAWTVCLSKNDTNLMFSGGDDCKLNFYDLRVNNRAAIKSNKNTHNMGVTSMVCPKNSENSLWTGSYDENLRLWDIRNIKYEMKTVNVGGGVWRIKLNPNDEDVVLVAAMHDGFKVVQKGDIVHEYREHESLAYGADWVTDFESETAHSIVATCSFYDCLFKVWSYPSLS